MKKTRNFLPHSNQEVLKMKQNNFRKRIEWILLVGILILLNLNFAVGATTSSSFSSSFVYSANTQYSQPGTYNTFSNQYASDYWPILANSDKCEATTDFIMFVEPGSCNPTVVRSDLLEEQNVPIFCKVDMIKLNPFIDVSKIKSVKFENKAGMGNYIAGVSFHPNNEAIYSREVFLDKPFINGVGYVVVLLKRIPAEKNMPKSVNVNLTGVLRFDSEGFFGTGQNDYYLEEFKDEDSWRVNYKDNSAFKGAVYLRADSISEGSAMISLYRDADTKIRTFNLKAGETSEIYYLPGFYCRGKIRVKLDDIVGGVKKVSLSVDDNSKWYVEGEKFLDNNCQITKINLFEGEKSVDIYCKGMSTQKLVLGSSVATTSTVSWRTEEINGKNYLIRSPARDYSLSITNNMIYVDNYLGSIGRVVGNKLDFTSFYSSSDSILAGQSYYYNLLEDVIFLNGKYLSEIGTSTTASISTTTPTNVPIDELAKKIYDKAKEKQSDIKSFYGDVESSSGEVWSAKSLYDLADLAEKVGMNAEAADLFNQVVTQYSGSSYARGAAERIGSVNVPTSAYDGHYIKLNDIKGPMRDEVNAEFELKKDGEDVEINNCADKNVACKGKVQAKETFADVFKLMNIYQDRVEILYSPVSSISTGTSTSAGTGVGTETFILNLNDREQARGGYTIKLKNIKFDRVAKVSLIADIPNQYSNSDFAFEIGIEKRAIQLSPETAQEIVDSLNKTISDLSKTVEALGNAVKTMKGVCLATSAVLITKNFFSGISGGATARQDVMPMWYDKCKREAGTDRQAFDNCLNNHNDEIENDIKIYKEKINSVNDKVISIQKANINSAGSVERKDSVIEFKKEVSPINFEVEKYVGISDDLPEGKKEITKVEITQTQIDAASLTDLRDIKTNSEILNSGASDVAKNAAKLNLEKISARLQGKTMQNSGELLSATKNGDNVKWTSKVNAQYFLSGTSKGLVHIVPIPGTYGGKTGFYAVVDEGTSGMSGGYSTGADVKEFWIQNIGADENLDIADDTKTDVLYAAHGNDYLIGKIQVAGLDKTESARLVKKSVDAIKTANRNYGKSRFSIDGTNILVDTSAAGINEKRCQDFMSPKDCWMMFNACDPVLCPSSRCDLGGRYRVDNVIQSGIVGSTLLCLPNIKEKIIVPVCLSGIHAGLDAYLSILKSYQDCLKENIATGRTVGICDEIHSVYLCEFFWKQAQPIMNMGVKSLIETANGQGMKGGGEYLTVQDAWKQASDSVDYMKNTYAVNAYTAFKARSSGEIGTEFCKAFVSASVPNQGTFDALLEPDSPVQFYSWFDEIKYTDATVPATSQYKVYYHIWAGRDFGANYQIYLKNPDTSAYVNVQNTIIVDTGYIPKGGYQSQTKDFTAPAGYKELCVRINGKDECGFKKVSTSFAVNYLTDQYYADQLKADIRTKNTCVSGSASAYSLIQPNVQSGAQEVIDSSTGSGNLNRVGITRVCANANPGKGVNEARWKDVGYCDDESVRCWLDTNSVKQVIQDKQLETQITQTGDTTSLLDKPIVDTQTAQGVFAEVRKEIENMKTQINRASNKQDTISNLFNSIESESYIDSLNLALLFKQLDDVEKSEVINSIKAEAVYLKFEIYYILGKAESIYVNEKKAAASSTIMSTETITTTTEVSWKVEEISGKTYLIRSPARDYTLYVVGDAIYVDNYVRSIGKVVGEDKLDFTNFYYSSDSVLKGQSYYTNLNEDVNYLNGKSLSDLTSSTSISGNSIHTRITATTFYVGEKGGQEQTKFCDVLGVDSDKDLNCWVTLFGGIDSPTERKSNNNFCPANFVPKHNPFYVALPCSPVGPTKYGVKSWVRIDYNEQTVYAQWYDVGPKYTNDCNYVFGDDVTRPKAEILNLAGIDVSPAVMFYLNGKGYDTINNVKWQFVDSPFSTGPWTNWPSLCA
ncbi:MAG: hypothetical protein WC584_01620 [Candidatus Pacearchaeota archaeon]